MALSGSAELCPGPPTGNLFPGEAPIAHMRDSAALAWDDRPTYEQSELLSHIPHLLSPRELECVQLRQQGLRYDEIAAALKISPGR